MTSTFAHLIFGAIQKLKLQDHFILIGTDGWGSRYVPQVKSKPDIGDVCFQCAMFAAIL